MAELSREQQWLKKLVGEWEFETRMEGPISCPGGESMSKGTEKVRAIGDLWIQGELNSVYQGAPMIAITSLGYDANLKKIVGTWFCSFMGYMWVYSGTLDEKGHTLTLDTVGPDMKDPTKTRKYQDITTIDENGKRVMFSQTQDDNGQWQPFMRMSFTRK